MTDTDTICALSTPLGESGIGLVRLSGSRAISIADAVFRKMPPGSLHKLSSHTIHYGHVVLDSVGEEVLDEVLLSLLRAPRTYTREDMVEISAHGGPLLLRQIVELLVRRGARHAQPGEFTRRAFLNGRIDLSQAEAVMEVIGARTEIGLKTAMAQLQGRLGSEIQSLSDRILQILVQIEADLDFSEEGLAVLPPEHLRAETLRLQQRLQSLLAGWEEGRILREGLSVAIVGRANVGKSSLMNALLGAERAIVAPSPGTTRDTLEEWINLRGMPVKLIDMAGFRTARDPVEAEGLRRARVAIDQADLLLLVLDMSQPLRAEDGPILEQLKGRKSVVALNKSDLLARLSESMVRQTLPRVPLVLASATEGLGIETLRDTISDQFLQGRQGWGEGAIMASARHKAALDAAVQALDRALTAMDHHLSGEFLAQEFRSALDALGEIIGATSTGDLLDHIFEQFCIGK